MRNRACTGAPMAEELFAAKGLSLRLEIDPALQEVTGDERKIEQVVTNLLSNAIKYTDQGEIRLSFKTVDADHWTVAVSDTGAGISKEDQKEIFSEFYRVETTSSVRGVGLGLAICCRLVDLLHGDLRLTSTLGKGSTFEVVFPRAFTPTPPVSPPASSNTASSPSLIRKPPPSFSARRTASTKKTSALSRKSKPGAVPSSPWLRKATAVFTITPTT